jgi:uncharacterized membrane protein
MTLALNLLGPAGVRVRDFLHGRWFGHPLHPLLTDIPAGAWTAALVLDGMAVLAPRPAGFNDAARAAVGTGLAGAAAAALAGLADWQFTHDNARRVGLVHGTLNTAATALYCLSWAQRRRGAGRRARWAGAAGWAVMAASSYLGGSLVYRHRIGVDHSDKELEPRQFTAVLAESELGAEPRRAQATASPWSWSGPAGRSTRSATTARIWAARCLRASSAAGRSSAPGTDHGSTWLPAPAGGDRPPPARPGSPPGSAPGRSRSAGSPRCSPRRPAAS